MMVKEITFTDSALSDKIKNFFNRYKVNETYKYVSMIDTRIIQSQVVEIDFNDFSNEVKEMLNAQPKEKIHTSIYRAISEIFQVSRGTAELENIKKEDVLKFRLNNCEVFEDEVCSDPKLIYYENYDKTEWKNDEWFDVAKEIQKLYHIKTLRENKQMWYYSEEEGVWLPNADTIIEEACQKLVKQCTIKTRSEIKATIKSNKTFIRSRDLFDSQHINTQNGILNPKTFELFSHSHEYLTTTKLPFAVDFTSNNLKLWNHILTIIDVKDIKLIMELIWICISWKNPFKKMFVFKGVPNTQKSTLSDILVWMIGENNVSREKPLQFLAKDSRFSSSKFIGKRMNTASEIGNLTKGMIENQKALVGSEKQNTEMKGDNTERYFDPNKFVFLYTTNTLGTIFSNIDDNSIITRYQFLIFKNVIEEGKANGLWYEDFFDSDEDKQTAIETIINIVIRYKKAQSLGMIPKTKWSNILQTKEILKEQRPKEDKYFDRKRIIAKEGGKLLLSEIKKDFESYVGYAVEPHALGIILKHNGLKSAQSNGVTYYKGWGFDTDRDQTRLDKQQ